MGRPDRRRSQEARHQDREGRVPVGGFRPRDCQRPRRGLHQADFRRGNASHPGRQHRGYPRGRPDQRTGPGRGNGRRRRRHRQDHPPAPPAG
ncbi:hypothetical protein G6F46_015082 [Rhizopus delemar]|nr:hypothetical protein G6F46_015082 [Rhizopus delemar]